MVFPDKSNCPRKTTLFQGIRFYAVCMACALPLVVTVFLISKVQNWDLQNEIIEGAFHRLMGQHFLNGILVAAVIGPLLEETMFRLWLSFSKHHIAISTFVITYLIMTWVMKESQSSAYSPIIANGIAGFLQSEFVRNIGIKLFVSLSAAVGVLVFPWKIKNSSIKTRVCKAAILLSIFSFMLLHVANYHFTASLFPFVVVMCLPQLIGGITITYYRLQLGFFYGYAFHALNNFIGFIFM